MTANADREPKPKLLLGSEDLAQPKQVLVFLGTTLASSALCWLALIWAVLRLLEWLAV